MKQIVFTLLSISVIGLVSCRKKGTEVNIQQYDNQQIQQYIASHGLTGKMIKDTSGGDTTGMYYELIDSASRPVTRLNDTTKVSMVFSLSTFDGKYSNTDTTENHYCDYIGHIVTGGLPAGLRIALLNDLRNNGGSMRILIPSRMAYGVYGNGSGSIENVNTHIAGNQCLDYYVHLVTNINGYDSLCIKNYITSQSLTGYTAQKVAVPASYAFTSPLPHPDSVTYFYKIAAAGTGTGAITQNSVVEATYTGLLLDNYVFDSANNGADSISLQIPNLIPGVQYALGKVQGGGSLISMILPSSLCYGENASTGVPVNSCLRFEFEIYSVTGH